MASNTAGVQTLTTNSAAIYTGLCETYSVYNRVDSSGVAFVNIPGLHASGDWLPVSPGILHPFTDAFRGIRTVYAKADTNGAVIECGVRAMGKLTPLG